MDKIIYDYITHCFPEYSVRQNAYKKKNLLEASCFLGKIYDFSQKTRCLLKKTFTHAFRA